MDKNITGINASELRAKAEELLKKRKATSISQLPEQDLQKLIYEYEVHQIELELQNKELLQEIQKLKESEKLFNSFLENSPIYIYFKDEEFRTIKLSQNFESRFGKPLVDLYGKNANDLYPSTLAKVMDEEDKKVLEEDKKITIEKEIDGRFYSVIKFPVTINEKLKRIANFTIDITEHKQLEESLRISNSRYMQMVNSNVMGVIIANSEGKVLEANDYYLNLIDYSREEFEAGKVNWRDITPEEWIFKDEIAVDELLKDGKCSPFEKEYKRRDGSRVAVLLSNEILKSSEDLFLCFILDITEKKRAEEALKKSELLLKASIESQKDTIMLSIDKNYCYTYFNKVHYDVMKSVYGKEVEIGMNILDCITNEEDRRAAKDNYERALNGESHTNIREYGDIEYAYFESFFNPIVTEKNEVIGATALARNITERIKLEQELSVSHQKYQDMVDFAIDGIAVISLDGTILDVNENICRITRRKKEEIVGSNVYKTFFNPNSVKENPFQFKEILKGKTIINDRKIILPDGADIIVEMRTKIMPDNTLQSVMRDITYEKTLELDFFASLKKYRDLTELSIDGIIVVSTNGTILEANSSFCNMTGIIKEKITGKLIIESFFTPDTLINIPFDKGSVYKGDVIIKERKLLRVDGTEILVEMRTKKLPDGTIKSILRDITQRKQLEEKLKERETILVEAQKLAQIGSWEWDLVLDKAECSDEMFNIFDVNPDEFDGTIQLFVKKFQPEQIDRLLDNFKKITLGIRTGPNEYNIIKNGLIRNIFAEGRIEFNKEGKPIKYFGIVQDITDRKKSESQKETINQLRQTAKYVNKALEKERHAISRELHDDIGQSLTALKMELKNIEHKVSNKEFSKLFDKASLHIDENIKTVQKLTSQLRPAMLEHLGLTATIEWYTKDFSQRTKIKVLLDLDDSIEILANVSLVFYRVMQEALTNISRYSCADKVTIYLHKTENNINFKIADNGIGIKENQINSKTSFGIIIMEERVASIGGLFEIYNENGTVVNINIPIINNSVYENFNM